MTEQLDQDGYPTPKCLKKIAEWPYGDPLGWFEYIHSAWYFPDCWDRDDDAIDDYFDDPVIRFSISTAGWSGNESIIEAMQQNALLWAFHWVQSRRGGHYIFEVKKEGA